MPPERRAPPRVVPTLTAVVEPQALVSAKLELPAPAPAPAPGAGVKPTHAERDPIQPAPIDVDGLVRNVMQQLEPMVRDIVETELARAGQLPIR